VHGRRKERSLDHRRENTLIMPDIICQVPVANPQIRSTSAKLHQLDPLKDPRWEDLLKWHPGASIFHSSAWLEALRSTYGYEPVVYTTTGPGKPLENGIPFCRIDSWVTGRRLVSLPFSDYCAPLVRDDNELLFLAMSLAEEARKQRWRYIEMRPIESPAMESPLIRPVAAYTLHRLDLRPDLDTLFANLHKSSIQRKIKRAQREGLTYQEGSTESIFDIFYQLLAITRQRHRVPPQPRKWFQHLMERFGEALKIRIASKDGRPVAGMLTIRHKDTLVYKYGGSDIRFNNLGGMHLLYWNSIVDAKSCGLRTFDLGRTDFDQTGLITFKSRWGAAESNLLYLRVIPGESGLHIFDPVATTWGARAAKRIFATAPTRILSMLGTILYKHIG
jgi:CelD/BcsL family acetyltransferase involved in cellulose biosynthesis